MKNTRFKSWLANQLPHRTRIKVFNFLRHRRLDIPDGIGLEISTACNRHCSYCLQSTRDIKQRVVSPELWRLFINRLVEYRWRGLVTLHLFNEPALVSWSPKMVEDLCRIGCLPYLYSNGDKPDMVRQWCEAGAFRVRVTEHEPFTATWWQRMEPVAKRFPNQVIVQRLKTGDMIDHAGQVEVAGSHKLETCHASWNFSVGIDGQIGLCCADIDHLGNFGNIQNQSFAEIWNGARFREARRRTALGISAIPLCDGCWKEKPV